MTEPGSFVILESLDSEKYSLRVPIKVEVWKEDNAFVAYAPVLFE